MTDVLLGLDGEMTGAVPPDAHKRFQLVQIGLAELYMDDVDAVVYGAKPMPHFISSIIGHDRIEQDPGAMAVHGITEAEILAGPKAAEVESILLAWMDERGIRKAIPVGYSVGSFDMPFVRETLPNLARRISMRNCDLNALVFAVSKVTGRSYKAVKARAKVYAEKQIKEQTSITTTHHDAGFDALVAIYSLQWFTNVLVVRETHEYL